MLHDGVRHDVVTRATVSELSYPAVFTTSPLVVTGGRTSTYPRQTGRFGWKCSAKSASALTGYAMPGAK